MKSSHFLLFVSPSRGKNSQRAGHFEIHELAPLERSRRGKRSRRGQLKMRAKHEYAGHANENTQNLNTQGVGTPLRSSAIAQGTSLVECSSSFASRLSWSQVGIFLNTWNVFIVRWYAFPPLYTSYDDNSITPFGENKKENDERCSRGFATVALIKL